jgi:hypothetical protein
MTTIRLIKEQLEDSILSHRQWWSINDNLTATVAYGEKICCVWVETLQGRNISREMANIAWSEIEKLLMALRAEASEGRGSRDLNGNSNPTSLTLRQVLC